MKKISATCIALVALCISTVAQGVPKLLPFQGRLADQNGTAVADGARSIQFRLYDAPVGGKTVWAGEVHRTTVNGGLVNVVLGTKASLDAIDFNRTLYLDIVVDANGDNQITAADPPLLPRQAVLPVVFANESANTRKLQGFDWSALFGADNPVDGKLPGSRIAANSIGAAQIAAQAITEAQIADGTITAKQLGTGIIGTNQLADGAVTARSLSAGAVGPSAIAARALTHDKLALRQSGTNVAIGGVAMSEVVTNIVGVLGLIENLSIRIKTTGRPVCIMLVAGSEPQPPNDTAEKNSHIAFYAPGGGVIRLLSDGKPVGSYGLQIWGSDFNGAIIMPSSSVSFIHIPEAGEHLYQISFGGRQGYYELQNSRLIAFEL